MAVMSAADVQSREDFVRFVQDLFRAARDGDSRFYNSDVPGYLEAVSGWANDMPGYFANEGRPVPEPSWGLFAMILEAAASYE